MRPPNTLTLLLLSACAIPVDPTDISTMAGAMDVAVQQTAPILQQQIATEKAARRSAVIARGDRFYMLDGTCPVAELIFQAGLTSTEDRERAKCEIVEVDADKRIPSTAERVLNVLGLLTDYLHGLAALAQSDGPSQVADAETGLINQLQSLATAAKGQPSSGWALTHGAALSGITRFGLEQYKARTLRRTVRAAHDPFDAAIHTLVAYLTESANPLDPIVAASAELDKANREMKANPGSEAAVARFEAAFADYQTARGQSAAVRLMELQTAHDALADRLVGPPTVEEVSRMVDALTELRNLIQTP